jgi:hypothetical protein
MEQLKRYDLTRTDDRFEDQEMIESDTGKYVMYDDVAPTIEAYNKLLTKLNTFKNDVRTNAILRIQKTLSYMVIANFKKEELPLHINDYKEDSPEYFIITSFLEGKDPFEENISKCMQLLYDVEFSASDYMDIGYSDGMAVATHLLYDEIGKKEESHQAFEVIYSLDL